ncbi:hypothetical protein PIB30_054486 [Stylosanthes scabra]|uniref:Uncharacterized protein n=1 Tax=Stylosanthes scabra TaxID=79078 RepID=A0ABU6QIE1_9FABA|nr:hypothetical protein [Stylosanthes scabra]
MAKKKSYQNIRVPRVLSQAERDLYGWVDEEIFTQPSVVKADMLPELRREMRLTVDRAAEGILCWRLSVLPTGSLSRLRRIGPTFCFNRQSLELEGQIQSLCIRTKGAYAYALPCLGRHVLAGTGPYAYAPKGPMHTHQWPDLCL